NGGRPRGPGEPRVGVLELGCRRRHAALLRGPLRRAARQHRGNAAARARDPPLRAARRAYGRVRAATPARGPDAGPDGELFRLPARARRRAAPEPVSPGARGRRAGGAGRGRPRRSYAASRPGTRAARARAARLLLAPLGGTTDRGGHGARECPTGGPARPGRLVG